MARKKKEENGEETEEETHTAEDFPLASEHERVTKAGEENLKRQTPDDLDEYSDGTFQDKGTGEEFQLKKVPDDPAGLTHHLKNELHFHALNEEDFKRMFQKA